MERYLGEVLIDERQYESLEDLTETELEALDFSELVSVTDEELEHYHNKAEEHPALLPLDAANEYNALKEQHPDALVGFEQGGQFEFYGEDARKVCELVGGKLLEKETELGTIPVTGFPRDQWAYRAKQLWQCGENVYLAGLNEDGTHHQTKYLRREDYLPLGATVHMEGRAFRVDNVNFDKDSVTLQDVALAEMRMPIFREAPLAVVRELYEQEQDEPKLSDGELDALPISAVMDRKVQNFPDAAALDEALNTEPALEPAGNFHITDDDLGIGGPKQKYARNIEAIRTLFQLEQEHRGATAEEQQVLSQYVGWGGLADAFDPSKDSWAKEYAELKGLLSEDEYAAARSSVLNAHYTSPTVIRSIYDAVERMGFHSGNILEPSMGVGNFFGMLPDSMADSRLYGVELDSITGRIAKKLYPQADITVAGYETTDRRDFYDLAVGNVPFGQYKVNDKAYNKLGFSIHNYFFAKAIDQVRPGGIVAFVTSRYTMDSKDSTARKHMAERADLLGAIRLPNNAFKANAGTDVVSDIIFLQKRDRPADIEPTWVQLGQTEDGFTLNSYFIDHPEMVLGQLTMESTQYGHDLTVAPIEGTSLADQLAEAVQHIEGNYTAVEITAPDVADAFVVATHTDRQHIHNHVIFNSTALDGTRKFRDFFFSALAVQRLSDLICLEHQLSVIEKKPYRERQKRVLYPPKESNRDRLCGIIDTILAEKPEDYKTFLQMLEQQGFEVKRGKHTAVKGKGQKRFIRFRTLGSGYSEDEIKAALDGKAKHQPYQKKPPQEQPFQLLVDIQGKMAEGKSVGYKKWATKFNLKEMSKTLLFLQEQKIGNAEELRERAAAATERYHAMGDSIKAAEARLTEIAVLKTHIINYAKTRPVYDAYRKSGYSKKFLEAHREEITLHKAAKAAFDEVGLQKLPKVKELDAEFAELLTKKKAAYPDYRKARNEMQELVRAQKNVERFFAEEKDTTEKTQTR